MARRRVFSRPVPALLIAALLLLSVAAWAQLGSGDTFIDIDADSVSDGRDNCEELSNRQGAELVVRFALGPRLPFRTGGNRVPQAVTGN